MESWRRWLSACIWTRSFQDHLTIFGGQRSCFGAHAGPFPLTHTQLLFSIFSPRDEWRETTHQNLPLNVINYVHMFIFCFTHSFYKGSAKIIKHKKPGLTKKRC